MKTLYFRRYKGMGLSKNFMQAFDTLEEAVADKSTRLDACVEKAEVQTIGEITTVMVPTRTLVKSDEDDEDEHA